MKPIPVVFHIGPLQIHTYGIGLAITFWVSYRYFARRLRSHGYDDAWFGRAFIWIIIASVVGARAVHVVANWGFYSRHLGDILAVWHGGLSSFGGLLGGVPTGVYLAHRWCKSLRLAVAADLVAPVLVLAWAIGRLLGPQFMYAGGGYPTTAWYGMEYAGQVGKRLPVPIFQSLECLLIYFLALQIEKYIARRGSPFGVVAAASATLYGGARLNDESVLLPHGKGGVAVEVVSVVFVIVGLMFTAWLLWRDGNRLRAVAMSGGVPGEAGATGVPGTAGATGVPGEAGATGVPGDPWGNPQPIDIDDAGGDDGGGDNAGDETLGESVLATGPEQPGQTRRQ
ncbi:MAG: prolipoprotein diacylglyceryl transferase family protein [Acidimicrobiales bacterium]